MTESFGLFRPDMLASACQLLAAVALAWSGLGRRYWSLVALLVYDGMSALLVRSLGGAFPIFQYLVVSAIAWALMTAAVVQVFGRGLAHFPAIARFSKKVIFAALVIGCLVSVLTLEQDVSGTLHISTLLTVAQVGQRGVTSALTLSMLIAVAYLAWLPLPLPPNVLRNAAVLFLYLLTNASVLVYWNRFAARSELGTVNLALSVILIALASSWALLLRPAGEEVMGKPPTPPADPSPLLRQLDALNRTLARN